jgi:hypothetical protein
VKDNAEATAMPKVKASQTPLSTTEGSRQTGAEKTVLTKGNITSIQQKQQKKPYVTGGGSNRSGNGGTTAESRLTGAGRRSRDNWQQTDDHDDNHDNEPTEREQQPPAAKRRRKTSQGSSQTINRDDHGGELEREHRAQGCTVVMASSPQVKLQ